MVFFFREVEFWFYGLELRVWGLGLTGLRFKLLVWVLGLRV